MNPLELQSYANELPSWLSQLEARSPWNAAADVEALLTSVLGQLPSDFERTGDVVAHPTADVHPSAVLAGPVVMCAGVVVGPNSVLRGGVFLGEGSTVGPSTEVKSSWVFGNTALAHLNYIGNSVIGHGTNVEAGAVLANHFNERDDKEVSVSIDGTVHKTGLAKFGAAVGPGCRIGANAVTTPGTYLAPGSVVGRLELVDQQGQT